MENWAEIRECINGILRRQHHHGTRCFLTTYQIAVLVNEKDNSLRGELPIGGMNAGRESFAGKIAKCLSNDIKRNEADGLEMRFFSMNGLDSFSFDNGNVPSGSECSMFRITS